LHQAFCCIAKICSAKDASLVVYWVLLRSAQPMGSDKIMFNVNILLQIGASQNPTLFFNTLSGYNGNKLWQPLCNREKEPETLLSCTCEA